MLCPQERNPRCCSHSPFSFGQDFRMHTALADPSPGQSLSPAGGGPCDDLLPACHSGHPACFALYVHRSWCHLFLRLGKWAPPHRIPLAPAACATTAHKPERHSATHRKAVSSQVITERWYRKTVGWNFIFPSFVTPTMKIFFVSLFSLYTKFLMTNSLLS